MPTKIVLQEACNLELVQLPRSKQSHLDADPKLGCNYHQNIGHAIEHCSKDRDIIEELIQYGALTRFIKKSQVSLARKGSRTFDTQGGHKGCFNHRKG